MKAGAEPKDPDVGDSDDNYQPLAVIADDDNTDLKDEEYYVEDYPYTKNEVRFLILALIFVSLAHYSQT